MSSLREFAERMNVGVPTLLNHLCNLPISITERDDVQYYPKIPGYQVVIVSVTPVEVTKIFRNIGMGWPNIWMEFSLSACQPSTEVFLLVEYDVRHVCTGGPRYILTDGTSMFPLRTSLVGYTIVVCDYSPSVAEISEYLNRMLT